MFLLHISQPSYAGSINNSASQHRQDKTLFDIQNELYLEAEKSLKASNLKLFAQQIKKIAHHPLKQYLIRDKLIIQLQTQPNSDTTKYAISEFLANNSNQVVSRSLRYSWLNHLLATKQDKEFLAFYRPLASLKLRCHKNYLKLKSEGLSEDIRLQIESIWLTGQSIPKYCDQMISEWRNTGGLNDFLIWKRMKLAVKKKKYSLASYLNRMRESKQQNSGDLLLKLARNPKLLNQLTTIQADNIFQKDTIYLSLSRLAWLAPQKAIVEWKRFSNELDLSVKQVQRLKRSIGLALAISGDKEATDWLASIDIAADDSVQQWLLSTALVIKDWALVDKIANSDSNKLDTSDRWRYWQAVSLIKNGDQFAAKLILAALAKKRNYYGFLAARDLNLEPSLNLRITTYDQEHFMQLSKKGEAQRALALFQLGRLTEARKEWNSLQINFSEQEYIMAAHLAHQWGWSHQAILAFAKSNLIDDIEKRFPLDSREEYQSASQHHEIPMSWAYAITRQESAFRSDATSSAGAQGLMQLKPSTARGVARKKLINSSISKLSRHQIARQKLLLQPSLNIQLGIAHLKEMLDYYNGNPILATAAYNAGPSKVDSWLKDNHISNSIQWIEQIPYRETREYVKNVLTYQEIYSQLVSSNDSYFRELKQLKIPIDQLTTIQVTTR